MQQNIDFNVGNLIDTQSTPQAQALTDDNNLQNFNPILLEQVDKLTTPVSVLLGDIKTKNPADVAEFETKKIQLLKTIERIYDLRFSNALVSDEVLMSRYENIIDTMFDQEFKELKAFTDMLCKLLDDDLKEVLKGRAEQETITGDRVKRSSGTARALDKLVIMGAKAFWNLLKETFKSKTTLVKSVSDSVGSVPLKGAHTPPPIKNPNRIPSITPSATSSQKTLSGVEAVTNNTKKPSSENASYPFNSILGQARRESMERRGMIPQNAQNAQGSVTITGNYPLNFSRDSLNSIHSIHSASSSISRHSVQPVVSEVATSSGVRGYLCQALITLGAVVGATYGGYRGMKAAGEAAVENARAEVVKALEMAYRTNEIQQEMLPKTSISILMSPAHAALYIKTNALINTFKPLLEQFKGSNTAETIQIGESVRLRGAALSKNTDLLPLYLKENALEISKLFLLKDITVQGIREIQKSLNSLKDQVMISSELQPEAEALTLKLLDLKKLSSNIQENLNSMNERLDPSAKALLNIQISLQRSIDAISKSFNSPNSLTPEDVNSTLRSLTSLNDSLQKGKDMCEKAKNTHCANLIAKLFEKINDVKVEITNFQEKNKPNFNILGLSQSSFKGQFSGIDSNQKQQGGTFNNKIEKSKGYQTGRQ